MCELNIPSIRNEMCLLVLTVRLTVDFTPSFWPLLVLNLPCGSHICLSLVDVVVGRFWRAFFPEVYGMEGVV